MSVTISDSLADHRGRRTIGWRSLQRSRSPDLAPGLLCSARRGHRPAARRRTTKVPRLPPGHGDRGGSVC
jgi:hypothetical protein